MLDIQKTIKIKGTEARVSSRDVAKVFNKNHKEVLRDINKSFEKMPDNFRERTFALSKYKSGKKEYPEYLMNRDGFTIIAMGYTGEKAMKFKIAYIQAFNDMESYIKSRA